MVKCKICKKDSEYLVGHNQICIRCERKNIMYGIQDLKFYIRMDGMFKNPELPYLCNLLD